MMHMYFRKDVLLKTVKHCLESPSIPLCVKDADCVPKNARFRQSAVNAEEFIPLMSRNVFSAGRV
jgi:hypothetical protein